MVALCNCNSWIIIFGLEWRLEQILETIQSGYAVKAELSRHCPFSNLNTILIEPLCQ